LFIKLYPAKPEVVMAIARNAGKYRGEKTLERTTCSTVFSPPRMDVAVPWTELKNRTVRVILVDMVQGKFWQGNAGYSRQQNPRIRFGIPKMKNTKSMRCEIMRFLMMIVRMNKWMT
jgi:hypothetical protein